MKSDRVSLHSERAFYDPNWQPPDVVYGADLIRQATDVDCRYVVVSMPIPWALVEGGVARTPEKVVFVPNMHVHTLEEINRGVPDNIELVIGVGGGSSHDCAKYIALKKNARLMQFPTIFGGDAVVTTAIGIRDQGRVKYVAHVTTDRIYVDFDILRKAPPDLVRYGAADVLSSYTALLDWRLAADRGQAQFDEESARHAQQDLLGRLRAEAGEVKKLSEEGIKAIVELYLEYHRVSHVISSDRAQEGSEHFVAYNAEYVANRTFVHGALLSLGILVSGGFFHNRREETEDFLRSLGLEYSLDAAGLTVDEFTTVLTTLKDFVKKGGYYYSVVNEINVEKDRVAEIMNAVRRQA